jgi:hypothetical protein
MSDDQALQQQQDGAVPAAPERGLSMISADSVRQQVNEIQQMMDSVMKEDTHYGKIAAGMDPTLLKPGAEKLCFAFRLDPEYDVTRHDLQDGHREYEVTCTLYHIPSGDRVASGVGLCTTMESKYRYRKVDDTTEVDVPNDFWDSGDDMSSRDNDILRDALDEAGVDIPAGGSAGVDKTDAGWKVTVRAEGENPDIADTYNTVLKMAKKRAHVDATLSATAASDIFTQDIEDLPAEQLGRAPRRDVGGQPKQQPQHTRADPDAGPKAHEYDHGRTDPRAHMQEQEDGRSEQWYENQLQLIRDRLNEGAPPKAVRDAADDWPKAEPLSQWPKQYQEAADALLRQAVQQ